MIPLLSYRLVTAKTFTGDSLKLSANFFIPVIPFSFFIPPSVNYCLYHPDFQFILPFRFDKRFYGRICQADVRARAAENIRVDRFVEVYHILAAFHLFVGVGVAFDEGVRIHGVFFLFGSTNFSISSQSRWTIILKFWTLSRKEIP